jgi:radical SAM superfamily enzyme
MKMNSDHPSYIAVMRIVHDMNTYSGKTYLKELYDDSFSLDDMIYTYNHAEPECYPNQVKDDIATAMKTISDLNERLKKQTSEK